MIAPRTEAPATLAPGELLSVVVEVATGLTPPPGIQEDRALRLFALSLCADGIDLGGGARRCFPLAVRNLRPLDGSSLRYRVEAPVPVWVAPWVYDLSLRFPGGQVAAPRALIVRDEGHADAPPTALVRVHVGSAGLALAGGSFRGYPLPDGARGFAPGFVALVQRTGAEPVTMTKRQASAAPTPIFRAGPAYAGSPVALHVENAPPGGRVFWWLDPARGALGSDVTTVFLLRGQAPLQLLLITADGRSARRELVLPIWQRRAFGCALKASPDARPGAESLAICFILLARYAGRSGRCRRGARFAIRRPEPAARPRRAQLG